MAGWPDFTEAHARLMAEFISPTVVEGPPFVHVLRGEPYVPPKQRKTQRCGLTRMVRDHEVTCPLPAGHDEGCF